MSKIAGQTGGIYLLANNEQDVIAALFDFITGVTGNSRICSFFTTINQDETKQFDFNFDFGASELIANNSWYHSKVGLALISPSGKVYSGSNAGNWFHGENYNLPRFALSRRRNHKTITSPPRHRRRTTPTAPDESFLRPACPRATSRRKWDPSSVRRKPH